MNASGFISVLLLCFPRGYIREKTLNHGFEL